MCVVTQCGCGKSSSGGSSTLGALAAGLVWLLQHVVAPVVAVAAVLAWRWLSGAAMTGKPRPATWLRGAVPPARPARRFVPRIHWAYWPGWQRAIVRWAFTALVVAGWLYPLATALTVAAAVAAAATVRYRRAIRRAFRPDVIRVRAEVVRRPMAALTAHADAPVWPATAEQVVTR